jgi:hypothetical protein
MSIRKVERFTNEFPAFKKLDQGVVKKVMAELYDAGFIDYDKIRNKLICDDFAILVKENTLSRQDMYRRLGAFYLTSPANVRRLVSIR